MAVPVAAFLWLMGLGRDSFKADRDGEFWWRGAFCERAGIDVLEVWNASRRGRAGTERHTRNEPDPESGIRISPGSSIPVERGMV